MKKFDFFPAEDTMSLRGTKEIIKPNSIFTQPIDLNCENDCFFKKNQIETYTERSFNLYKSSKAKIRFTIFDEKKNPIMCFEPEECFFLTY